LRKALIEKDEYETNKHKVISMGSRCYENANTAIYEEVDLTDWPIFDSIKATIEDVYYAKIPVSGKYFIVKWASTTEKEDYEKKKLIYKIASQKISDYAIPLQIRDFGETKGVARGLITATTLNIAEDNVLLQWIQDIGTKHRTIDLSTISISDIYPENTSIFPPLSIDPKLNGY